MRKIVIVLSILVVAVSGSFGQMQHELPFGQTQEIPKKTLSELSLKGNVKYIKTSFFDTRNNYEKLDSIVKGDIKHSLYLRPVIENTYDKTGNLIVENKFNMFGTIRTQLIYLYDNDKLIG